jgi:hypothetical protein
MDMMSVFRLEVDREGSLLAVECEWKYGVDHIKSSIHQYLFLAYFVPHLLICVSDYYVCAELIL